jgi:hypothetical protein
MTLPSPQRQVIGIYREKRQVLKLGADIVTTPLHNLNVDLKPAFPEALCIFST